MLNTGPPREIPLAPEKPTKTNNTISENVNNQNLLPELITFPSIHKGDCVIIATGNKTIPVECNCVTN